MKATQMNNRFKTYLGENPKFCSRCVLPENYPGIYFDTTGVCNFCKLDFIRNSIMIEGC